MMSRIAVALTVIIIPSAAPSLPLIPGKNNAAAIERRDPDRIACGESLRGVNLVRTDLSAMDLARAIWPRQIFEWPNSRALT